MYDNGSLGVLVIMHIIARDTHLVLRWLQASEQGQTQNESYVRTRTMGFEQTWLCKPLAVPGRICRFVLFLVPLLCVIDRSYTCHAMVHAIIWDALEESDSPENKVGALRTGIEIMC